MNRMTMADKRRLAEQIAGHRAAGMTLPQIAAALGVAHRTVERYVKRFAIPRPEGRMRRVTRYEVDV